MGKINEIYKMFSNKYIQNILKCEYLDYDEFEECLHSDLEEELENTDLKLDYIELLILDNIEEYFIGNYHYNIKNVINTLFYCEECKKTFFTKDREIDCMECKLCGNLLFKE